MKRAWIGPLMLALLLAATVVPPSQAAGVSGAIFTTTFNGSVVNGNQYGSKCDVYLDGGPGPNAPAHAAGLPDGEYYFQVTDPSGKNLLSTDPVSNRRFEVENGVIVAYTGTGGPPHPIGMDQDHPELAAITIRLAYAGCPSDFLDSPNNGGVYKVWATPVEDFVGDETLVDNDCGKGCFHGFVPSKSKTDNFRAGSAIPTFCLTVIKEFEDLASDTGFSPRQFWPITITDPIGVPTESFTDENGVVQDCSLPEGMYTVVEDDPDDSDVVELIVNGVSQTPQPVYSFTWDATMPEPVIVFRNAPADVIGIIQ
jgi:hypothetical protein